MRSIPEILEALKKLSRMKLKSQLNETLGAFYGRMHFVDGLRQAATELANWIVGDESEEIATTLRILETKRSSRPASNGPVLNKKVHIEPDLVDEIRARGLKISDAINNALALYYLKQMRMSARSTRRKSLLNKSIKNGRVISRISMDEDLYEKLDEHAVEISDQYDVQPYRTSLLNAALRLYLWSQDVLNAQITRERTRSKRRSSSTSRVPVGTAPE